MKKALYIVSGFLLFTFSGLAQLTFVPDNNFEQALIDLGLDDILDDYILTSNIETVESLNVGGLNISDLTGIEDFVSLTTLYCYENNLTELNVQNLVELQSLNFSDNQISNIDLTNNTNLYYLTGLSNNILTIDISQNVVLYSLHLQSNSIESIDLSNNHNLDWVRLANNNLTSLDVTQNLNLRKLEVDGNPLLTLDVSLNLNLETLACVGTMIDSLDLSQNVLLNNLWCYLNELTFLDVRNGNNENINFFTVYSNPELYCILVDDADYSATNWLNIDDHVTFVETQKECDLLSNKDDLRLEQVVSFYPNPIRQELHLILAEGVDIDLIRISNHIGKVVYESNFKEKINLSQLSAGLYFIEIRTLSQQLTKKLIKY